MKNSLIISFLILPSLMLGVDRTKKPGILEKKFDFTIAPILWIIADSQNPEPEDRFHGWAVIDTAEFLEPVLIEGKPVSRWTSPNAETNRRYLEKNGINHERLESPKNLERNR